MQAYEVFRDLAIILIAAKMMGLVARKCRMPQVVGQILAGLIIGPSVLGWVQQSDFLAALAEIGVVLLMFSAGLETDLKELIRTGPVAFLIACCGVLVPLVGGTLLYMAFYGFAPWGDEEFYKALFIGTIMTATSVSITVQCLKEMGKLKGKVGTTIVSAAIIDDVIGIVVLTFVIGLKNPESDAGAVVVSWTGAIPIPAVCPLPGWLSAWAWRTSQKSILALPISRVPTSRVLFSARSRTVRILPRRWIPVRICSLGRFSLPGSV